MSAFTVVERTGRDRLGEGPLWSPRDNALYWVDILGCRLNRLGLVDGNVAGWTLSEPIGWVIERASGDGFIAGLESGFAELRLDPFAVAPFHDPEPDRPANRMNDAKADDAGRIWAGTMPSDCEGASGSLYRLDPDHSVTRVDTGYTIANGPALMPGGEHLFHTDSKLGHVYRYRIADDGSLCDRTTFLDFAGRDGTPDGMTFDADGGLWIALWGAGRIDRYTPDARLDRSIALPALQLTSCAFAGAAFERLFVTSAAEGDPVSPHAGALFEVDAGVRGFAARQFAA
ncbi:SMP-30/gluconolactonase/LRE family protein [Sphingopyxis sp.]|uniref:SMP-30/gluconolactonase/LRE family protein n=1 Tax=Sphingopyxis sp. TaxID=1908224 RepID=UPI002FCCAC5A